MHCIKCGKCCDLAEESLILRHDQIDIARMYFPFSLWKGKCPNTRVCPMLSNKKCLVYENRPLICNSDRLFDLLKVPQKERELINESICRKLRLL